MNKINLPEDSREIRLFNLLEKGFAEFLNQLPPSIAILARQQGTYYGDLTSVPFGGLGALNPVLVGTPWLFWECYSELDDHQFVRIAQAGAFYVLASVVLDHLVDKQSPEPGSLAIYHQALYSRGTSLYRESFPQASVFWEHFERLESMHLAGLAKETAVQSDPIGLSWETLAAMAQGKVAPIILTMVALSIASARLDFIPLVEASLEHIAVASQLLDDIGDWQDDLKNRHLTYFLTRLADTDAWSDPNWPLDEALETRMQTEWMDVDALKRVRHELDQCIDDAAALSCPRWLVYVDGYRQITDGLLERCINSHLQRILAGWAG